MPKVISAARLRRSPLTWGIVIIVVMAAVAGGMAYVYNHPLGRTSIQLDVSDAASIPVRADVRIAGVSVGQVEKTTLMADRVRVELSVDSSYPLGDMTSAQVRMLTAVGGYYIALLPSGTKELGDAIIPKDRVQLPYSLGDLIDQAPQTLDAIDTDSIRAAIDGANRALQGSPEAGQTATRALETVVGVLSSQRSQIAQSLQLSDEYSQAAAANRATLFEMLRKATIILQTIYDTRDRFGYSYRGLAELMGSVGAITKFYVNHRAQVVDLYNVFDSAADSLDDTIGPLIIQLEALVGTLKSALPEQGGPGLLVTDICIPVAGRAC